MWNKKRCMAQFTFYDRTGIQAYLEKMAAKGWMLEKVNSFYWQFKRIEPKQIHYAVTYFPKASEFDPEPSEKQQMLIAFCEKVGWKFIAKTAQMQIFYNEEENPVPIETDALVELENIHKSAKANFLIAQTVLLACALLQLGMIMTDFLKDPFGLMGIVVAIVLKASDAGWFEKKPVETYESNGYVIEIFHDELPLIIEDMMDIEYDRYSYEMNVKDSWLLTSYEAYQNVRFNAANTPELRYDITVPKISGLYEFCLNAMMESYLEYDKSRELGYRLVERDASLWNAEKVYYSGDISMN